MHFKSPLNNRLKLWSQYIKYQLSLSIFYLSISIYLYKNGRTDVCLFVCLSVGMWRANRSPNPCTDLDEILHIHPQLSKEGFGPGPGGLKP